MRACVCINVCACVRACVCVDRYISNTIIITVVVIQDNGDQYSARANEWNEISITRIDIADIFPRLCRLQCAGSRQRVLWESVYSVTRTTQLLESSTSHMTYQPGH